MVIRILVFAGNKREARDKAQEILDELCESRHFDYGTFFDEESPVSGKVRWGGYPTVAEVKTPSVETLMAYRMKEDYLDPTDPKLNENEKAWALILEGVKWTIKKQKRNLQKLRIALSEYKDEDFWFRPTKKEYEVNNKYHENLDIGMIKFYCYSLGQCKGPNVYLYDNDGEGITDENHLRNVLKKWEDITTEYVNLRLFVVPVDVHFLEG